MELYLFELIMAVILAMFIHEFGHTIVCKFYTGNFLDFYYTEGDLWGIKIPRFIWSMPKIEYYKQRNIAAAGFIFEFIPMICTVFSMKSFWIIYAVVVTLHYVAYPYYAGENNDFKWIY